MQSLGVPSHLRVLLVGIAVLAVSIEARGSDRSLASQACAPSWRAVATAQVPNLADVVALSPTDVWAVGAKGQPYQTPVIVHWDGRKLRAFRAFRPSVAVQYSGEKPGTSGTLDGIAAFSSNDIWAVGTDGNFSSGQFGSSPGRPVVEHWDGTMWRVVTTPRLRAGGTLDDVAALSRTDVWAVGQVGTRPLAELWDGRRWRVINIGQEGALYAVDGASTGNVWAVGAQGLTELSVNDIFGLVMRWNGRRWQYVPAPSPSYSEGDRFAGVDANSTSKAWATHNGGTGGSDIQRWDGRRWRIAHVFRLEESSLSDIAAVSPNDVWAVGSRSYLPERPLIVHWDGSTWRVQHVPFERLRATLSGLSALSPSEVWAVGEHLIARYSCSY
jgi:hypothetical protein